MDICQVLKKLEKRNLFITGGGGVGKSWMIGQLKEELPLVLTSSTGISAINIEGQTIHSWAGIGIADKPIEQVVSFITKSSKGKNKFKEICSTKYLVIDEISMLNSYTLDYINEVLKQVRGIDKAFGGIRVLLVGDFFQLPPVKIGEAVEINGASRLMDYCFNSKAWKELNLETIYLKKVWRQTDKNFIETLNNIRIGKVTKKDKELLQSRNYPSNFKPPKEAVKLYAVNEQVDAENKRRFDAIKEKEYTFEAIDKIRSWIDSSVQYVSPNNSKLPSWDKAKYEAFDRDCRVPKILKLKKGARVMLLKNISFDYGLVNGSCGYITKLNQHNIEIAFDNGEIFAVEKDKLELKDGKTAKITREQYPLRLAYSQSIHKAQGATFDSVYIDCSRFFECGQAYVALSRARTLDKMYLTNFDADKIYVDNKVVEFYKGIE